MSLFLFKHYTKFSVALNSNKISEFRNTQSTQKNALRNRLKTGKKHNAASQSVTGHFS